MNRSVRYRVDDWLLPSNTDPGPDVHQLDSGDSKLEATPPARHAGVCIWLCRVMSFMLAKPARGAQRGHQPKKSKD